ncbi:MAG: hypothetical protein IJT47_02560 [Selenomonadaceae bacterium]|nr:hypothetical protein [Selenomonadaceae bacterium]
MKKNLPYFYGIYDNPDEDLFHRQCVALEKKFPAMRKDKLLQDVDGSLLQIYHHERGSIRVCNDYCLGDLYVESDFDLLPYFN